MGYFSPLRVTNRLLRGSESLVRPVLAWSIFSQEIEIRGFKDSTLVIQFRISDIYMQNEMVLLFYSTNESGTAFWLT